MNAALSLIENSVSARNTVIRFIEDVFCVGMLFQIPLLKRRIILIIKTITIDFFYKL